MRKLITRSEAKLSSVQHKTPCSDCPFRRDSMPGWLGGNTPEYFMQMANSDFPYSCHTKIGPQCAGMAVFRSNICKSPRDPDILVLPKNKVAVFAWHDEFIAHHSRLS
jgi:hypothetical protein